MQKTLHDSVVPVRLGLLIATLFVSALASIAQLPATAPTALAPIAAEPTSTPPASRPHRADISFSDGLLTVHANDSSLHQILSSISHQTGMKITGGVAEERVFGSYGPATAGTILATLLDGTGVNMLIQEGDARQPIALVLTPRGGGPTPPAITPQDAQIGLEEPPPLPQPVLTQPPPAQSSQQRISPSGTTAPSASQGPPSMPQPANNVLGSPNNVTPTASEIPTTNSVPTDSLPTPSTTTQTSQGIVDTPNPPPAGSGISTPDQIYQQLLQLQQAKTAAASGSSTTTPAPPPPRPPSSGAPPE